MSRAKKSQSSTDPRILFGQRVAYLRKQIGWSQEKLALESNIARSYLGGVERGQRNIALVNICCRLQFNSRLNMNINQILRESLAKPYSKPSAT